MLNLKYFSKKEYQIPKNAPETTRHKYRKVIDSGYAPYLDVVYHCDGFAMYKQIYKLVKKNDGVKRSDNACYKRAIRMIKNLEQLGFVGTGHINQNKFMYLKKPAFALVAGDYMHSGRVNLAKDFKNDKFRIAILKMEYFIERDELLHNKSMFYHLTRITKQLRMKIYETDNKYGYSLEAIDEILKLNDYHEIKKYLEAHPEYRYKLDVVRVLWNELGTLYAKMVFQRETVLLKPVYLKLFVGTDGQVILHYIPNIIIFDVSRDKKYFLDKSEKLFNAFYKIEGNALRGIRNAYLKSGRKNMGYEGEHHIGYVLTIVGEDLGVLKQKSGAINETIGSSVNTPVMDEVKVVALDTGQYLYHVSRKGNEYSRAHDERIESLIASKLIEIERKNEEKRRARLEKESERLARDIKKYLE